MPAAYVPLVIDQGEDWTTDIIWTDNFDEPVQVVHPCRLDVKGQGNQTVLSLITDPELPEGEIPGINISTNTGLIQLHVKNAHTSALMPGSYHYDLFVTSEDDTGETDPQVTRLLYGPVTINKRVTAL